MVKIRLTRLGRHKSPFYRLVAVDARTPRDGDYIELLGTLEPFKGTTTFKKEAILKWLSQGAQPTDTAKNILKENGIWKEFIELKDQAKHQKAIMPKKAKIVKVVKKAKVKLSSAKPIPNSELKAKIAANKIAAKTAKARRVALKKTAARKATTKKITSKSK